MANVNVRIDGDIKKSAEEVFKRIGLTPSSAINLFYVQVIRTNSIPFELKAEIPNEETLEALEELKEIEKNPNNHKSFKNAKEILNEAKEELKKNDIWNKSHK